jgi:hypothetical protein
MVEGELARKEARFAALNCIQLDDLTPDQDDELFELEDQIATLRVELADLSERRGEREYIGLRHWARSQL